MVDSYSSLDTWQQAVVDATDSSIRVVAPAGSGKTQTLSLRVQRLIRDGVDPRRILLLTFDNNARNAIGHRLTHLNVPNGVRVSTLNAFGFSLLNTRFRDERNRIIRDVYFPQSPVLSKLVEEYGHSVFTEMLSKIKNEAIDPRTTELAELARWCSKNREHLLRNLEDDPILDDVSDARFGKELARETQGYEQFLEQRNGIDFDDQKLRPLIRLQQDADALTWLQQQFDEVIVDEFQDINRLDAQLIDLVSTKARLVITGDDDQAIYGFRGATADFLIHPKEQFHRQFRSFELAINYRCPPRILASAGKLISWNEHRIEKNPRASKSIAGEIEVQRSLDIDAEGDWVAQRLKQLLAENPRSAAILARRRAQLVGIQAALIRQRTPYRVALGDDIRVSWSLASRALQLAPLRLRGIPEADVRAEILRIFTQARSMPDQRAQSLVRLASNDDLSFPGPELLQQLFDREQRDLTEGIKALTGEMPLITRLRMLDPLLNTELRTYMEGGKEAARDRSDREKSRLSGLIDLVKQDHLNKAHLIERIEVLLAPQRSAYNGAGAAVELSTCHGAKGREWQIVCIPHCNQGVFPDSRSDTGLHLEAERKLFYVSMTRASEHLIMTWSEDRAGGSTGEVSDFLVEANVAQRKKRSIDKKSRTWQGKEIQGTFATTPRSLKPDGGWAMPAPPKPIAGPRPRYLTLVTPRGRSMQNAQKPASSRELVGMIELQHTERNIGLDAMSVRFAKADAIITVPLQLELALRRIPFAITPDDHFAATDLYQEAKRAWAADAPANVSREDAALIDALATTMERITASDDSWVWLDRLEDLDESITGVDAAGVQFVPQ